MDNIIDSISNRDWAILFWMLVVALCSLLSASVRASVANILKMIFWSKLTAYFAVVAVYTMGIAYFLWQKELWDSSQLKNTILWYFTVGAASLFEITNKEKSNYFKSALIDVLGITAIVQFIIGIYNFSFFMELLFVPIAFLFGSMLVISKRDTKYVAVRKLLNTLMVIAGLFLISYAIYHIVSDFKGFANEGTLNDFLIPALFSFLYVPVLYLVSIVVTHEDLFTGIERKVNDPILRRYARWMVLFHFHVNKTDLNRWRRALFVQEVKTKEDVKRSVQLIRHMKRVEKTPPDVEYEKGWSPYKAKDFLKRVGIATGFYHPSYENEWMACSEYVKLDGGILANNIAYYLEGNANVVTKLKLTLNIYNKQHEEVATSKFQVAAKLLYESALMKRIPDKVYKTILLGRNFEMVAGNRKIIINRQKWTGHETDRFTISIEICVIEESI